MRSAPPSSPVPITAMKTSHRGSSERGLHIVFSSFVLVLRRMSSSPRRQIRGLRRNNRAMSWKNPGWTEGADPISVHLDRDSSLQKCDRYADSIAHSDLSHNPFQPAKRPAFQSNSLTHS